MGRDSSEAVELTDEVFLGETGPLAKGYRIDKDDGVVSADVLEFRGQLFRELTRLGGGDSMKMLTRYIVQVWRPSAEAIDRFNEWGWTPAGAEVNGDLENTVVFTTQAKDIAESILPLYQWERVAWFDSAAPGVVLELDPPE
jgi:hypothetical protein